MKHSLRNRFQGCLVGMAIAGNPLDLDVSLYNLKSEVSPPSTDSPLSMAFYLLVLSLKHHGHSIAFTSALSELASQWQLSSLDQAALVVWYDLFTQVLRETICTETLFQFLRQTLAGKYPILQENLMAIANCWQARLPLQSIKFVEGDNPWLSAILGAIYAWGDTPSQFAMTVQRGRRLAQQPTAAFAGALSGAYNGLSGIPYQRSNLRISPSHYDQLLIYGDRLYCQWTGALVDHLIPNFSVITLPLVMQPRPSLKLVSQESYWFCPLGASEE